MEGESTKCKGLSASDMGLDRNESDKYYWMKYYKIMNLVQFDDKTKESYYGHILSFL